jgi:hypothetical protein
MRNKVESMKQVCFFVFAIMLFCSCATGHFTKGHDDVGQFILQQAMNYGGNPATTNGLPAITEHWHCSEDAGGVVIFMSRSDYPSVQSYDSSIFWSAAVRPKRHARWWQAGEYRLTSKGGGIQFSRDDKETEVIIIRPLGQRKSGESQ